MAESASSYDRIDADNVRHLGKLTVREMLFFTLYHNLHHAQNVARRTGIAFADEPPLCNLSPSSPVSGT